MMSRILAGSISLYTMPSVDVARGTVIAFAQALLEQAHVGNISPPDTASGEHNRDHLLCPGEDDVYNYKLHGSALAAVIDARKDLGHVPHVGDCGTIDDTAAPPKGTPIWCELHSSLIEHQFIDHQLLLSICLSLFFEPGSSFVVCIAEKLYDVKGLGTTNQAKTNVDPANAGKALLARVWRPSRPHGDGGIDLVTIKELNHVDPMRLHDDPASAPSARGDRHHILYGPSGNMLGAGALVVDNDDVHSDCDHCDLLLSIDDADESNQCAMGLLEQAMPAVAWNKHLAAELLKRLCGDDLNLDSHLDDGEAIHSSVANHFRAQVNAVCDQDNAAAGEGASGPSRVDATLGSLDDARRGVAGHLSDSASVLASAVSNCCRVDTNATGDLSNVALALTTVGAVDTVKGVANALNNQKVKAAFGRMAKQPRHNRERAAAATRTPPVTAAGFAAHANTTAATELGPNTNTTANTGLERATSPSSMATFMDESTLAAVTALRGAIKDSPKAPSLAAVQAVTIIGDRFVWLQAKVVEQHLTTSHNQAAVSDNCLKTMALHAHTTAEKAATEPPATCGLGLAEHSSRTRKAPEHHEDVSAVGTTKKPSKGKNKKKRVDTENSKDDTDDTDSVDPTDDAEDADDNGSEVEAEGGEDLFKDVSGVPGHRINVDDVAVEFLVDFGESRGKELEFDKAFRAADRAGPGLGRYRWVTKSKVGNRQWEKISALRTFKKFQVQLKRSSEGVNEAPILKRRATEGGAVVALARTDSIATFLSRLMGAANADLKKRIEGHIS